MFIDIDCSQKKKYNQNAYGDFFKSERFTDMNRLVAVLSDGLGSGIKADILACMTSTMLLKFLKENADIAVSDMEYFYEDSNDGSFIFFK